MSVQVALLLVFQGISQGKNYYRTPLSVSMYVFLDPVTSYTGLDLFDYKVVH